MYFSFKLIFCILLLIDSIFCYSPDNRNDHNSVIVDDRLLIFNGYKDVTDYTSELFYLDLSKSFDNDNLTWTLISEISLPVITYDATAVLSPDNSTIYLIGGVMKNKITHVYDFSHLVFAYDYLTSTWSVPELNGEVVPPRQNIKGVIDNSGIIYIFGGFNATNLKRRTGVLYNDMNILNIVSNTWTKLSISKNHPIRCAQYTANILPNGIIVYIGGSEQVRHGADFTLVNINAIKLFDTRKHEWSYMKITGSIDSRVHHTSVLTPDGYIIVFGGRTRNSSIVSPNLALLDTNKNPFEWYIPPNSKVNSPPPIWGHSADLYYDYMITTFGFNLNTRSYTSQVYLYNIKSNKWVTTFSPPAIACPPEKMSKILTIVIETGLGVALLISCIFIIFITRRNRQKAQNR
ncbi:hypothetical protein Glove_461g40 [Diversispora epigaea]|uniref:Galactose oxidase n=1 Tax=Diversispora epigaea TaxID=1348612 RepID=A0A397GQ45_9GLOM|nr:hypothetical protein Glove_461g40 [Diversispora epigaea]